jgi:hypothetical protein
MTALPVSMSDQDIRREFLTNETRALLEPTSINIRALVRNVFDAQALDVPFKTVDDADRYLVRLIEGERRPMTPHEAGQLGRIVVQEFNTRRALSTITRKCACCDRDFRLDEQRFYVLYDEAHTHVCRECCGDTRGVPSSTIREQLREDGLGVEDLR